MDIQTLVTELTQEEALKLKPYRDSKGYLTIGVGRNLDVVGISVAEAEMMLSNDIYSSTKDLDKNLPWWRSISENRQQALCDMCFNIGIAGLLGFHNMLAALQSGDYETAAQEAQNSNWYNEVGTRGPTIVNKIRNG